MMLTLDLLLVLLPVFTTWDCYTTKCVGIGQYRSTYIDCNNRDHYCATYSNGYPKCNPGFQLGDGVNCTNGEFVCNWDSITGVASCRASWDCYDKKCKGQGDYSATYITCDNEYSDCDILSDGWPACIYTGLNPSNAKGVNCTSGGYECDSDDLTGVASCIEINTTYSNEMNRLYWEWDCYDKKCKGGGDHSSTYINCDNRYYQCDILSDGYPTCFYSAFQSNRKGVNCTSGENGCSWSANTGAASCREIWNCYDKKCQGQGYHYSSTYIYCDNNFSYCTIETYALSYGYPKCVYTGYPDNRTGVNCTIGESCKWVDWTGVAFCRAIWNCYDKKCKGQGDHYGSTYITCDNRYYHCSTDRKGFPECGNTGYPDIIRQGVNCTGKQNCTQDDETGVAFCKDSGNSTITNIVLTISFVIIFLVTVGCCYVYRKRRIYRNQAITAAAVLDINRSAQQPAPQTMELTTSHNMELSTAPPPDYTQQQNYPQYQLLQVQGIPDEPPPSYEHCVSNFEK